VNTLIVDTLCNIVVLFLLLRYLFRLFVEYVDYTEFTITVAEVR
jgi:hypothetical protein